MFALRGLKQTGVVTGSVRARLQAQQTRNMSGGGDDGVHRVNWWDAPTNPDIWEPHHLAWWTVAAYTAVYYAVASLSGGKKEEKPAAA